MLRASISFKFSVLVLFILAELAAIGGVFLWTNSALSRLHGESARAHELRRIWDEFSQQNKNLLLASESLPYVYVAWARAISELDHAAPRVVDSAFLRGLSSELDHRLAAMGRLWISLRSSIAGIETNLNAYFGESRPLFVTAEGLLQAAAARPATDGIHATIEAINALSYSSDAFHLTLERTASLINLEVERHGRNARSLAIGCFGILAVSLLLGVRLFSQRLSSRIVTLHDSMRAVVDADFKDPLAAVDWRERDEIGELARFSADVVTRVRDSRRVLTSRADELVSMNAMLQEAERLKSEFFANVSHELRTPLTMILAPLESIRGGAYGEITAEQRPILDSVHSNTVRLLQLVNGLLDFAKVESGKFEVRREPAMIVELARSILADFEPLMKAKDLRHDLVVEGTDSEAAIVLIDRYIFERILSNLLSNAIKFTPRGGEISVSVLVEKERLKFVVRDSGIGIDAGKIQNLFQRFRQLEGSSTRRFEGTGLGLALVKEFAQLLGGDVSVVSQVEVGSAFTVECSAPRASIAQIERGIEGRDANGIYRVLATSTPAAPLAPGGSDSNLPHLLIAEDNVELAYFIANTLRHLCRISVVHDGCEALSLARSTHPDLLLADVMMPGIDGLALCREIKADHNVAATPVILLTALTHRDALVKGWEAGADEYLFKPFHPSELIARVSSILAISRERKRGETALRQANEGLETIVTERTKELTDANAALRASEANERLARQDAERLNRAKDEFITTLSHELRTPLVPILGLVDMFKGRPTDRGTIQGAMDVIERNAKILLRLIEDLLDISRVVSGKLQLDITEVEARTMVLSAVDIVAAAAAAKQIEIGISIDPRVKTIAADAKHMQQVLWNLLSNSVKFTPKGGRIDVRIELGEGSTKISVVDTGIGIDAKFLPHLFERFYQVDMTTSRKFGGLGVGLALVRHIVEAHGGTVAAASDGQGHGSTFSVSLPVTAVQASANIPIRSDQISPAASSVEVALTGISVLVVDDDDVARNLIVASLRRHHADIEAEASAASGMVSLKRSLPDILLCDIGMPEEDGYSFIRRIRSLDSPLKDVPAIAISAYASKKDELCSREAGFQLHIPKPIDMNSLIKAIVSLTGHSV